jgi:ATP-dependent RNA helicase DeaD
MTTSSTHGTEPVKFTDIIGDSDLIAALTALHINQPTPVQAAAIPVAMRGKDIVVQAQTGSGKTLAFVLPLVSRLRNEPRNRGTLALIITPTRELALQVKTVVDSLTKEISPALIIGGINSRAQEKQLRDDPRIVVGTPGRLLDFLRQRILNLRNCKAFVLDEADEMLSMGFLEEVRSILSKLPRERQGMFYSATITPRVSSLASSFLVNPTSVLVEVNESEAPKIDHLYCKVDAGVTSKANALCKLFTKEGARSAIVFCNTKSDTELLEVFLRRRGFNARRINSDLSQKERDTLIANLKSGELQFLIATDVAARGIDIKQLELVVNYTLHDQPEVYVHRTGRTGRAGASGKAVSLIGPPDLLPFHALKKQLGIDVVEIVLPKEDPLPHSSPSVKETVTPRAVPVSVS